MIVINNECETTVNDVTGATCRRRLGRAGAQAADARAAGARADDARADGARAVRRARERPTATRPLMAKLGTDSIKVFIPLYNLSPQLERPVRLFAAFYSSQHSGRKLNWLYSMSKGELVTNCFKNRYTFQASTFQMAVLLKYNKSDTWTVEQLQQHTGIDLDLLVPPCSRFSVPYPAFNSETAVGRGSASCKARVLQSLVKAKLLACAGGGSELAQQSTLHLYLEYKNIDCNTYTLLTFQHVGYTITYFVLHIAPPDFKSPIPTRAGNVLATHLGLRVSMGGVNHLSITACLLTQPSARSLGALGAANTLVTTAVITSDAGSLIRHGASGSIRLRNPSVHSPVSASNPLLSGSVATLFIPDPPPSHHPVVMASQLSLSTVSVAHVLELHSFLYCVTVFPLCVLIASCADFKNRFFFILPKVYRAHEIV
ncbi:Cullin-1 [Eumeta japonica]|uniref:Cullin-1 n=1 Tax=Eumeta variegata TaxID=151549 RepID=A0A4C1ZQZ6_EUMVA|nr:Cullin-1 [Eumeta japonica]